MVIIDIFDRFYEGWNETGHQQRDKFGHYYILGITGCLLIL